MARVDSQVTRNCQKLIVILDYPIKRFAHRHVFGGTDAIAARDLGFAVVRQQTRALTQTQTQTQTWNSESSQSQAHAQPHLREHGLAGVGHPLGCNTSSEHSYGYKRRERDEPGYSRERGASPTRRGPSRRHGSSHDSTDTDIDRRIGTCDRWDNHRNYYSRSARGNKSSAPPAPFTQHTPSQVQVPSVVKEFTGTLPPAQSFNGPLALEHMGSCTAIDAGRTGPVFCTDDLLRVFRNVVIPSASGPSRAHSPYPRRGESMGGRPPPDYGPYKGPTGGRRGERY